MQSFLRVVSVDLFIYLDLNDYLKFSELLSAVLYCSSANSFFANVSSLTCLISPNILTMFCWALHYRLLYCRVVLLGLVIITIMSTNTNDLSCVIVAIFPLCSLIFFSLSWKRERLVLMRFFSFLRFAHYCINENRKSCAHFARVLCYWWPEIGPRNPTVLWGNILFFLKCNFSCISTFFFLTSLEKIPGQRETWNAIHRWLIVRDVRMTSRWKANPSSRCSLLSRWFCFLRIKCRLSSHSPKAHS